jgi:3-phenylpropionate/trans-cinnamate dioxygenase ferredoxin reductase component
MAGGVIIVGASLAGLRLAENLRTAGYQGALTVIGAEPHMPYNRPPLSKDVLTSNSTDAAGVLARLTYSIRPTLADVTWHLGVAASSLDQQRNMVGLSDGRELPFDGLGIASGLTPRRLPFAGCGASRHVVRTVDDALQLKAALIPGANVVVAGAGFIGCEVAATAIIRGCYVTVVEPFPAPMLRAIGPTLAGAITVHHEAKGIVFKFGRSITALVSRSDEEGSLAAVTLDDETEIAADLLVEATGSVCNTQWLANSGLDVSDGVATDNFMAANGDNTIVAAGDVARFQNPRYGEIARRVEHWAIPAFTAKRGAATLAAALAGRQPDRTPFSPLPTFWSDQFDLRLQSMGMPALATRSDVLEGSLSSLSAKDCGVAVGYWLGDTLIGIITIGMPVARLSEFRAMLQ